MKYPSLPSSQKVYQFEKLLALLSPSELEDFQGWLGRLRGKKQSSLLTLFLAWRQGHDWPTIAARLSLPGKPIADPKAREKKIEARLNHLRGELQEEVEAFFSWLALQRHPDQQRTLLLEEVVHRRGQDIFPLLNRKVERQLAKPEEAFAGIYDRATFRRLTQEQAYLVLFPNNFRKGEHLSARRISHWRDSVWFEALSLALESCSQNQPVPPQMIPLLSWIELSLRRNQPMAPPLRFMRDLLQAYRQQCWRTPGLEIEPRLIADFDQLHPHFDIDTRGNLHLLLFNALLRNVQLHGQPKATELLLYLFNQNAQKHFWPITRQAYRTVNVLLTRLLQLAKGEAAKVLLSQRIKTFLDNHKQDLPPSEQADAYAFNLATYYFALGKYRQVKTQRANAGFSDPNYEVGYQALLIQADYECRDRFGLIERLHALRQRLRKTKAFSALQKESYLNFVLLTTMLLRVETPEQAAQFAQEVSHTQPLSSRVWLELKAQALLDQHRLHQPGP